MAVACTGGSATSPAAPGVAAPTVDRARVPTAEVIQQIGGPTPVSGLEITDNCVVGRLSTVPGTGQIFGEGVNVEVDVDSTFTFSRAVSETAIVACRPGVGQADVQRLVAVVNGIQGARVRDFSWPGR